MSKIIFIKENSHEIRQKLREAGFSICACAGFEDSIWLDYHPGSNNYYDIHGVGYEDLDEIDVKLSPIDRILKWLSFDWYFSKDKEFYDTVEEFLKHYKK